MTLTRSNGTPTQSAGSPNATRNVTSFKQGDAPPQSATNGRMHPQRLTLYHPNSAGTGAAMQLEPRLNRTDSDRYNCFFMEMAAQRSVAARLNDQVAPASFDWEHKLTVKLDFADVCEILTVLEGKVDRLGGQRNGLFHKSSSATTIISLQKAEKGGYFLGLSRKTKGDETARRINVTLSDAEAVGLRAIFQIGLFFITFHSHLLPVVSHA